MSDHRFEHECLEAATFKDVNLHKATFDDVNLSESTFTNINLSGATFRDINFKNASLDECCIEGLTIWGHNIQELIEAAKQRQ